MAKHRGHKVGKKRGHGRKGHKGMRIEPAAHHLTGKSLRKRTRRKKA